MNWSDFETKCKNCKACRLCEQRTNVVVGRGSLSADVFFVGEGPGENEDLQGQPFVGAAGKLMDECLKALEIDTGRIYITNVVKCRPPQNRTPFDDECAACLPHLRAQFSIIRPKIVVCLGKVAAKTLLHKDGPMKDIRGRWENVKGTFFLATYHPAALLRDERIKVLFWDDMNSLKNMMNELSEGT